MLQRIHYIGRSAAAMAVQQRLGRRCPCRRDAQHTGAAINQLMRRRNAPFAQPISFAQRQRRGEPLEDFLLSILYMKHNSI